MSDSIKRSAAIHAVCSFAILRYKASPEDLDAIGAVLNALPSAQPEPRRGKWYECTACGYYSEYLTAYCPNCGADMRGTWEVSK